MRPQSWRLQGAKRVTIGDICELLNGRAFKPSDWTTTGLPIVRIQNLNNPGAKFNYFDGEVRSRFLIDSGYLLFAWSGTPGTSFGTHIWNGGPAVLNQHIFNIVFDETVLDKQFLRFALNQKLDELIGKAHGGVGLQHVTKGVVEDTEILLPALNEQRRLVDLLSRAEGIVRLRRQAQKRAAAIIPALFLDMFGDPATNPKGWPQNPLGHLLTSIDSGQSPKCHDRLKERGEWGVLRLGAVTTCEYKEEEHKTLPHGIAATTSVEVQEGDLLLTRKNTYELVGAAAYIWETAGRILLPDLIFRLNIADREQLHPLYLWGLLVTTSKRIRLRQLASGSAGSMPNISKERLKTLPIEIPPRDLQAQFANHVEQFRSISLQQSAASIRAEAAFHALLARVFSDDSAAGFVVATKQQHPRPSASPERVSHGRLERAS